MRVGGKFVHRIVVQKSKKGVRVVLQGRGPKGTIYPLAWGDYAQGVPGDLVSDLIDKEVDLTNP